MRCAILADVHGNLVALQAVLDDIRARGGVDEVWCLGDIVGYGPHPHECIEVVRDLGSICVAGNHDLAAIGRLDTVYFNPAAEAAVRWTASQLTEADIVYLGALPLAVNQGDFLLVHGSPAEPVMEYVYSSEVAARNFGLFSLSYCLVGHTHVPLVFREEDGAYPALSLGNGSLVAFDRCRLIFNPGSVGQPRDGDPRASYAVYDGDRKVVELHRVAYDIGQTQQAMLAAGLPLSLITRLEAGR